MPTFLGDEIRRLRLQRGLSQRDLAALVGVTQAQISLHEKGDDLPAVATRPRYAQALGIAPEDLEDLIERSRLKQFLRASPNLSPEAKRSMEDYIDFAYQRDRQAREQQRHVPKDPPKGPTDAPGPGDLR